MNPILLLSVSIAVFLLALLAIDFVLSERHARATLALAIDHPKAVSNAWVSAPDGDGYSRLFLQFGTNSPVRVALDHEVTQVRSKLLAAGISVADQPG